LNKSTLKVNDCEIEFEHNIADVKYWDEIYVVLLDIPNDVDEVDNIYGVDSHGKLLWRIENPIKAFNVSPNEQGYSYLASSIYVHMHLSSEGIFTANTFFAMKYTFDHRTGKLLKRESARW